MHIGEYATVIVELAAGGVANWIAPFAYVQFGVAPGFTVTEMACGSAGIESGNTVCSPKLPPNVLIAPIQLAPQIESAWPPLPFTSCR